MKLKSVVKSGLLAFLIGISSSTASEINETKKTSCIDKHLKRIPWVYMEAYTHCDKDKNKEDIAGMNYFMFDDNEEIVCKGIFKGIFKHSNYGKSVEFGEGECKGFPYGGYIIAINAPFSKISYNPEYSTLKKYIEVEEDRNCVDLRVDLNCRKIEE